jgi:hypothetical protein
MRREALLVAVVLAPLLGGCDDGQGPSTGLTEPLITNGQFIPGDLPGTPPRDEDAAAPMTGGDAGPTPLTIRGINSSTTLIPSGANGQNLGGNVSSDATAVGVKLQGLGSGYWVVPAGLVDPMDMTERSFGLTANFSSTIPGGNRNLLYVAIGQDGNGGVQYPLPMCFEPLIPDNGHACNPTSARNALPAFVLTLQWDANFDLDLHVALPNGDDINAKNPYGMPVDAGTRNAIDPNIPHIDRDSLRNCQPDGFRQEDVIFLQPLPRGTTTVYVDPYAACGQAATRFKFTLWERNGTCATCQMVQVGSAVAGEVLAGQVTGGVLSPLKIDTIPVN